MGLIIHLFVFGFAFQYGNAASDCPVPPKSSLIYFDLEKLNLLSLQQGFKDIVKTPMPCTSSDQNKCSKQPCCRGEVWCCFADSSQHISKCGCKKVGDTYCSYPAPLAIFASPKLENGGEHSACFRENRGNEENYILTGNKILPPFTPSNRKARQAPFANQGLDTLLEIISTVESNMTLAAEQLEYIKLHQGFNNVIQLPQLCGDGEDDECSEQKCCYGELKCCYADSTSEGRKCGCKKPQEKNCTFRAPLAILNNSECDTDVTTMAGICWREGRQNEGKYVMKRNSTQGDDPQQNKDDVPLSTVLDFYRIKLAHLNIIIGR